MEPATVPLSIGTRHSPPALSAQRAQRCRPKFQGTGHRLDAGGASTSAAAPALAAAGTWDGPDDSKPMTSIQIRMPDGSRLVGKFNLEQPIRAIRAFVAAARPADKGKAYAMLAGFPQKPVEDETVSIEAGGLKASVVVFK